MRRGLMSIAAASAFAMPAVAMACGACVEDKVAATYDHAVITRAIAKRQQVVFVAIDGPHAGQIGSRIPAAARKVSGVEAGTVRTSASPAAFSFAIDASAAPERAVAGFADALRDPGTRLTLVRIARDGVLIEPK